MADQDAEGVVYTDHSGDDQHRNQQQQQTLDLNATANEATGSGNINTESGGIQNGQPPFGIQPKAIDKAPLIGLDRVSQTPDLSAERTSHAGDGVRSSGVKKGERGTSIRHEVSSAPDPNLAQEALPIPVSFPAQEELTTSHTPRRRRHHSSSSDSDSSSGRDRNPRRRTYKHYKRTRDRSATPPIDGHTPFSSRILKVHPPKHFVKPTDMKYDGSSDPHIHLNDFEHRMICDGAVDAVKCRAFPTTLTGLASQCIDNTKHPINLLAVVQKPNETTRKYIERFNAECKTIDGVASLCLTNGVANDEFRKQLTTKPVWTRKEMQVISKEFIHREEVNWVVAATKNTQAHTAPRGSGQTSHPRDNHRDNGSRGIPKPPK
ncbi:hypothetical protein PIB30_021273 [Stylosanthes scabra]|uniref:Uncharacterized protein n=1 Tax=Stylosanthes scabra TaxID=79078 RepID=A0ABU6X685_9FABA|nr:hypothetical protein [Stylosanthes scabra]